jgi:ferredoxin-NADP reductase
VYLCGPRDWMRKVRSTLLALGVSRRAIHRESFDA